MASRPASRSSSRPATAAKRLVGEAPALPLERIWRSVLERRLRARLGAQVVVSVTDNTHTMLSFTRRRGSFHVRLHHMFLAAPEEVIGALADYLRGGDAEASTVLDGFIASRKVFIRRVSAKQLRRRVPIEPKGRHHPLQEILDDLCRRLFRRPLDVTITWTQAPRVRRPRRSIKLGSYSAASRVIRIHPALDQAWVPRWFVETVVFHELLHAVCRPETRGGQRIVHTAEFRARERRFPHHLRSEAWQCRHLDALLSWGSPGSTSLAA